MKKKSIIKNIKNKTFKMGFAFKKHSPEILAVAGVVGVIASTVMACKATTKISTILEDTKKTIDIIHDTVENDYLSEPYTEEDAKKDLAITYFQTGLKVAKLYAPSIILGTLSLTSILASNNILRKRNMALAAAYATVDTSFKKYRKRVVEHFGKEVDNNLRYGLEPDIVKEETSDKKIIEKEVNTIDGIAVENEFARIFDSKNVNWESNSSFNEMFIRGVESYVNERLVAHGRVFLNDVYEELGFKQTKAGQVVGWEYNPTNPNSIGDNYIDFNAQTVYVEGRPGILLDFNVDGNIFRSMKD